MVWGVLRVSPWIAGRIGATDINIFIRIMGLILKAIAVEFIANGIKGLFPVLAWTNYSHWEIDNANQSLPATRAS